MSDQQVTLTTLFKHSSTAMRVYDLGRRIKALGRDEFERIETLSTPYPAPYLQHAWLALHLWNPKTPSENAVWFLKLPLDEQGFMISAVRDDIVNRLLNNVQSSVQGVPKEDSLKDNPFMFKPSDDKMAVFHALAALDNNASSSPFYEPVQQFINDPSQATGWEHLSLQGLADFVIRLNRGNNEAQLARVIHQLPDGLNAQLLALLEHAQPSDTLALALLDMLQTELLHNGNPIKVSLLVRGISNAENSQHVQTAISRVLNSALSNNAELLAAIATRCETALLEPQLLKGFLEALATCDAGQNAFSRILADLMYLPVHRVLIVQALRSANVSTELINATDAMFGVHFRVQ